MQIDNSELRLEIEKVKSELTKHDEHIKKVFHYLDKLIQVKTEPVIRKRLGYKPE